MLQDCEAWLEYFLKANGRVEVSVIREMRKRLGYTRAELSAAKNNLGVQVENDANGVQEAGRWFWSLPQ